MGKEIVINAEKEQTRIAILENGELVELYIENPDNARTIGDIYLGRVRKIMPSIQAGFIDIGQKQDAFLHFSDLSDNLPQILEFLKSPNPHVGADSVGHSHRMRGKRRKPRGIRQGSESESSEEGEKKQRVKSDARERGRRRSAQRQPHRASHSGERRDRSDDVRPETFLERDQKILVKVVKEPISNKGSRVSTDISLTRSGAVCGRWPRVSCLRGSG
jgi:ribonuclease G